jgi:hypothetical protein
VAWFRSNFIDLWRPHGASSALDQRAAWFRRARSRHPRAPTAGAPPRTASSTVPRHSAVARRSGVASRQRAGLRSPKVLLLLRRAAAEVIRGAHSCTRPSAAPLSRCRISAETVDRNTASLEADVACAWHLVSIHARSEALLIFRFGSTARSAVATLRASQPQQAPKHLPLVPRAQLVNCRETQRERARARLARSKQGVSGGLARAVGVVARVICEARQQPLWFAPPCHAPPQIHGNLNGFGSCSNWRQRHFWRSENPARSLPLAPTFARRADEASARAMRTTFRTAR